MQQHKRNVLIVQSISTKRILQQRRVVLVLHPVQRVEKLGRLHVLPVVLVVQGFPVKPVRLGFIVAMMISSVLHVILGIIQLKLVSHFVKIVRMASSAILLKLLFVRIV